MDRPTPDLLAVCQTLVILMVFQTISLLLECSKRSNFVRGLSFWPSIEGRFCPFEVLKEVPYLVRALVRFPTQGPPRTLSEATSILDFLEQWYVAFSEAYCSTTSDFVFTHNAAGETSSSHTTLLLCKMEILPE